MNVWAVASVAFLLVAIVATVHCSKVLWARRRSLRANAQTLSILMASTSFLGLALTVLGLVASFGAVGGISVDPSQRASINAEAPGATTWIVCGVVLWAASAATLAWITRQVRKPAS